MLCCSRGALGGFQEAGLVLEGVVPEHVAFTASQLGDSWGLKRIMGGSVCAYKRQKYRNKPETHSYVCIHICTYIYIHIMLHPV